MTLKARSSHQHHRDQRLFHVEGWCTLAISVRRLSQSKKHRRLNHLMVFNPISTEGSVILWYSIQEAQKAQSLYGIQSKKHRMLSSVILWYSIQEAQKDQPFYGIQSKKHRRLSHFMVFNPRTTEGSAILWYSIQEAQKAQPFYGIQSKKHRRLSDFMVFNSRSTEGSVILWYSIQ